MTVKKLLYIALLLPAFAIPAQGQPRTPVFTHTSNLAIGLSGGHVSWDPTVGLEISSPSFAHDRLRLRLRGSLHWLEAFKASRRHWVTYNTCATALVYQATIANRARFYMELGAFAITPDPRFSAKRLLAGYYELNGVEVFLLNTPQYNFTFHIGIGPTFVKAYAEKLEGAPRYGNGLQYLTGVRYYF